MTGFAALGFDPAPGDLSVVEGFASDLTDACDGVDDALAMLDTDDDSAWVGKAAVAFRAAMSEDFRPQLKDTGDALSISRDALRLWATRLSGYQLRARALEDEAAGALSTVGSCSTAHSRAVSGAEEEGADPDAVSNAASALRAAETRLDEIRAAARRLQDEVDEDASATARSLADSATILEAYHGNAFGNWLADAGDWLADAGNWLMDNLVPILEDLMRAVLPIISILALFVPVLGTVALIMSVALVVIDGLQAMTGRGTWQDFFVGAGSLALGFAMGGLAKSLFPKGEVLIPNFNQMTAAAPGGVAVITQAPPIAISLSVHMPNLISSTFWTSKTLMDGYQEGTSFPDAVAEPWQNLRERARNTLDGNGPHTDEEL